MIRWIAAIVLSCVLAVLVAGAGAAAGVDLRHETHDAPRSIYDGVLAIPSSDEISGAGSLDLANASGLASDRNPGDYDQSTSFVAPRSAWPVNLGGGMGIMVGGPTVTYSEHRMDTPWDDDGWPARLGDVSASDHAVMVCGAVFFGGCYTYSEDGGSTWSVGAGFGLAFGMGQPKTNVDLPWFWGDET